MRYRGGDILKGDTLFPCHLQCALFALIAAQKHTHFCRPLLAAQEHSITNALQQLIALDSLANGALCIIPKGFSLLLLRTSVETT